MVDWTQVIVTGIVVLPGTLLAFLNKKGGTRQETALAEVHRVVNSGADALAEAAAKVQAAQQTTIDVQQAALDDRRPPG